MRDNRKIVNIWKIIVMRLNGREYESNGNGHENTCRKVQIFLQYVNGDWKSKSEVKIRIAMT